MRLTLKILFLSIFLSFLSSSLFSQEKNLDKIEMFYDQGNYKKVIKLSEKLSKTDVYSNNSTLLLFDALAEYQLSFTKKKYSKKKALLNYERFLKKDTNGIHRLKYEIYIYDMQQGIVNEIRNLNNNGKGDKAKNKYTTYQRLFGNVTSFAEIIKNVPVIDENEILKGNTNGKREDIVTYSKKFIGVPYKYGGTDKKGFDCSGFSQYVMTSNGYNLPRTAQSQSDYLEKIKQSEANKGDLVFFGSSKKHISHVGIVISDKGTSLAMIHASSSKGIMISNIENDTYWQPKLQYIARIIKD